MFHEKLKELRAKAKKTQKDLADYLMISPQSVSKWELGESLPSMEYLPKIAKFLNCEPNDFFDKKEYQKEVVEDEDKIKRQLKERIYMKEQQLLHFIAISSQTEDKEAIEAMIQETRVLLACLHEEYNQLKDNGDKQEDN